MTSPYRPFVVRLTDRKPWGASGVRITLTGDDLDECSPTLLDQRVKLVIGEPDVLGDLLTASREGSGTWYEAWQSLPDDRRPAMRTYTIAALRPEQREADIDVVVHAADLGPASRFAVEAPIGAELVLVAADRRIEGHDRLGISWRPVEPGAQLWLVGDETALPAIRNIVATLPDSATGTVVVEVPTGDEVETLVTPAGVSVEWCARSEGRTVHHALPWPDPDGVGGAGDESDEPVWEEATGSGRIHGWVAGEAGWVKQIRGRAKAAGIAREQVSYMGYWRRGTAAVG